MCDLPPELISSIVSYVSDDRVSLKSCLSVSTTWHLQTRPHLFRRFTFCVGFQISQSDIRRKLEIFLDITRAELGISGYVHELEITSTSSAGTMWLLDDTLLPQILRSLTQVQTFRLHLPRYKDSNRQWWCSADIALQSGIRHICSLPTLKSLSVQSVALPEELWTASSSLSSLCWDESIAVVPGSDKPRTSSITANNYPPLRSLDILVPDALPHLVEKHPLSLRGLRKARLTAPSTSLDYIPEFLNLTSASLSELEVHIVCKSEGGFEVSGCSEKPVNLRDLQLVYYYWHDHYVACQSSIATSLSTFLAPCIQTIELRIQCSCEGNQHSFQFHRVLQQVDALFSSVDSPPHGFALKSFRILFSSLGHSSCPSHPDVKTPRDWVSFLPTLKLWHSTIDSFDLAIEIQHHI
ncbi:hypothetical protein CC2G_011193 [Coprinopsis cinerea AmutBmut pab1-1]|nr:hypothetical protein CC2G_011193 [Coprinopsis cinerea AmutBmut pab1-1]